MSHVLCELDATDRRAATLVGQPVLLNWLAALGVDAHRCRRFRVLADGAGDGFVVEATSCMMRDGHVVVVDNELVTEILTVPLTSAVPPEVLAVGRR